MLMLEGQGIYRLGETKWYHVRAGDAIYMVRPLDPSLFAHTTRSDPLYHKKLRGQIATPS